MITKFVRLEFKLFTKPSKSDFLRVHQYFISKLSFSFQLLNPIQLFLSQKTLQDQL
jgi:hypothetical protein